MLAWLQWMLPRPTDIMSLRLDNTERQTVELADVAISSTRYVASWLRQRSWALPKNRCSALLPLRSHADRPQETAACRDQYACSSLDLHAVS